VSNGLAVEVSGLSKRYRLGETAVPYRTLRETLVSAARRVFRAPVRAGAAGRQPDDEIVWALRDVSFGVSWGEAVAIIGRNGAGKSTLLKVLSRVTEPTSGRARLFGRMGSLLEVGTGFHPELTGRENIFLNGSILGLRRVEIERKFDEIVAFAEVDRFLDTAVKHYSSGMYLRLAFAVAAFLDTEILVLDEVLAVGDVAFQKKCLGKMEDVTKEGRTVLFVSHNLGVVANLCTRAILLSEGRLVTEGPTRDVIAQYIQAGVTEGGERSWPDPGTAPGNERVKLHAVRIVSEGKVTGEVSIEEPVHVEVWFRNLKAGADLGVSIRLLDKMGVEVLMSANWPSATLGRDEWFGRPYPEGLFRSTCVLPGNFLNDGVYAINVVLLSHVSRIEFTARDVIRFHVYDSGAMRAEWGRGWIGVVRPRLAWKTELVGS
jgi:lipopolysaccharide transport system ATP-binding protein